MTSITQTITLRIFLLFLSVQFQTFMVQPRSWKDSSHPVEELETRKFQEHYNLKDFGKLDAETIINAMSMPKCGLPDTDNQIYHPSYDLNYAFFPGKPRWSPSKRHLTYGFKSGVEVFPIDVLRLVFQQAFAPWSQVTDFTFAEDGNGSKFHLTIGFYRGNHGDGRPFDGPGNTLAHAFAPMNGRLHFDADEKWSGGSTVPSDSFDLVGVAIHEIGHLLGLHHSKDPNAVMYPKFNNGTIKRTLSDDDIAGIKALYS